MKKILNNKYIKSLFLSVMIVAGFLTGLIIALLLIFKFPLVSLVLIALSGVYVLFLDEFWLLRGLI